MDSELGTALRAWRDRLTPASVGLPSNGTRRVPGLRREELAMLAGVSMEYVTRLEQGRAEAPSASVLSALSRALQLDDDEQAHLFRLAGHARPGPTRVLRQVPASVRRLTEQLGSNPVAVTDAGWGLLLCNESWTALFGDPSGLSERDRNIVWRRFTGGLPYVEHEDEDAFDRSMVGDLRSTLSRHPDDEQLPVLVRDLLATSDRFRRVWSDHRVRTHTQSTKTIHHPVVGSITVDCDVLTADRGGLRVVVYTAPPTSEFASQLDLLRVLGAQPMPR
ncbi:helix-turn-helix domain-containing protein [Auraticoccus monumenti]|uniref:Helix-turn-helix domain-containing protein n=1 Tax=Auraticoccus monumenti TaxID=675864 RepID=A0A1G6T777_9ACTN|nr:helix-turn-helix transcriptional regulator [Auraticoccus monumenti]SDD24879.1 Helix-turn-helix domain-containing protein [Auraticoccus monumenti]